MELKLFTIIKVDSLLLLPFNRTSMELKQTLVRVSSRLRSLLLIEPVWNWNSSRSSKSACTTQLLIEPVWNWNSAEAIRLASSSTFNRTSMELKLGRYLVSNNPNFLLIEPVWNWNVSQGNRRSKISGLLIEPVWNWNVTVTICLFSVAYNF